MTSMYERELERRDVVSRRLYLLSVASSWFLVVLILGSVVLLVRP